MNSLWRRIQSLATMADDMEHELILIGSIINHLPSAVFRLYSILQMNYAGQYEETGDSALVYCKEDNTYVSESAVLTPADATVYVAYAEGEEPGHYQFTVRMKAAAGQQYALTIPCATAFLQQYYYPVRRFLRANPAKYIRPGTSRRPREGTTIAVIDTEMQRPYITQFSGCILRFHDGGWVMNDAERWNVYIRLPEGVRVDPYVRKVTGLSREFLDAHGVDEEEALDQITAFLSGADLVCGHAVLSDIELLRERYLLAGRIPDPSVLCDTAPKDLTIASLAALQEQADVQALAAARGNAVTQRADAAQNGTPAPGPAAGAQNPAAGDTDEAMLYQPETTTIGDGNEIPACLLSSDLIDTQVLMEYLYDLQGMIKLERAAELAGVAAEGDVFHDARTDADVTARLLIRLWPEFVQRFGVSPIVKAAMMHAPKDTVLLNPILGKYVSTRSTEMGKPRSRSTQNHRNLTRAGHSVKRSVRAEQRRRGRIT